MRIPELFEKKNNDPSAFSFLQGKHAQVSMSFIILVIKLY